MDKQRQTLKLIVSGRFSSQNGYKQQNQGENNHDIQLQSKNIQQEKLQQSLEIKKILKEKYSTFTKWDFKQSLPLSLRRLSHIQKQKKAQVNQNNTVNLSLILNNFPQQEDPKTKKQRLAKSNNEKKHARRLSAPVSKEEHAQKNVSSKKLKKIQQKHQQQFVSSEMLAIKLQRRQRFKKSNNPLYLLKHYMEKQHFAPKPEEKHLIEKLIQIQNGLDGELSGMANDKEPNLEQLLEKIYKLMNLAVDYNELLFLALLICLAADICYFVKDYDRSFYFYNQSRLAGSYAHLDKLKIASLLGMGKISFDLQFYEQSRRLFRKALQYAWRINDEDIELEVYDYFGQILNQKGRMRESLYYHQKFAKNSIEPHHSVLRKISKDMLQDYDSHIQSLEDSNLNSLFLEYLRLPINKTYNLKLKSVEKKNYGNYDSQGISPRLNKQAYDFSRQNFLHANIQVVKLLRQDYQFKTQIPDPDKPGSRQLNRLLNKTRYEEFGNGKKRQMDFEHSIDFNKIIKKKPQKPNIQKQLKHSLDDQIKLMMQQKLDPLWYQNMVADIKKKRMEKVGALKEKVRISHLSYHKYPSERRRAAKWSEQKINESFNRTLLDWIDPLN